jgi:VWFA-related protein
MRWRAAALWLAAGLIPVGAQVSETPVDPAPIESGLEERVKVQLVLIDVVVVDGKGRTVADLTTDDFELIVGTSPTRIASLDLNCPLGSTADPRASDRPGQNRIEAVPEPRRIVLVFDYYHMENASEAIDAAKEALDRWTVGGEEHMLVSLGETLRVEVPFTYDVDAIQGALDRMRSDVTLYAGNHGTLTNWPFFRKVQALFDVLEQEPGRKSVVLFSGPFRGDGFYNDDSYKTLAAMAASSRTAVYPIDAGGLRTAWDPGASPFGGPPKLRRLANETGGRMVAETNDVTLAYAKAHRDMGCVYTLGFYDQSTTLDKRRRVHVYVRKNHNRLRVMHPVSYVIRSTEKKRRSLVRTAAMAPGMFQDDGLVASLIPVGPASPSRWDSLVAVKVRPPSDMSAYDIGPAGLGDAAAAGWTPSTEALVDNEPPQAPSEEGYPPDDDPLDAVDAGEGDWEVRAYVRNPKGTVVHSFKRRISSEREAWDRSGSTTLFDRVRLQPGAYTVSAVLSHVGAATPLATRVEMEVPPIPTDALFLVGPILGREADPVADAERPRRERRGVDDLYTLTEGDVDARFEPLVGARSGQGEPLSSLTRVCYVASEQASGRGSVVRRLATTDGEPARRFDPVELELDPEGKLACEDLVDGLPSDDLSPGDYRMTALIDADHTTTAVTAPLTIVPAD